MVNAAWNRQEWQYHLELPQLCYHPWLASDEGKVFHVLSHVWWIYIYIYIYIYMTKHQLYGHLPPTTKTILMRRTWHQALLEKEGRTHNRWSPVESLYRLTKVGRLLLIQDVLWKILREQWTIETIGDFRENCARGSTWWRWWWWYFFSSYNRQPGVITQFW